MTKPHPKAEPAPEPLPLTQAELNETPAEFRTEVIARLQRQVRKDLDRLEREGDRAAIATVPLRLGIVLTKHSELTAIAPPLTVHNQTEQVNGLTQAEARLILSSGRKVRSPQETGTDYEPESRQATEPEPETKAEPKPSRNPGPEPGQQRAEEPSRGQGGMVSSISAPEPEANAEAGPRPAPGPEADQEPAPDADSGPATGPKSAPETGPGPEL